MKPLRLSVYALSYTQKRGFTHSEVEEVGRPGRTVRVTVPGSEPPVGTR